MLATTDGDERWRQRQVGPRRKAWPSGLARFVARRARRRLVPKPQVAVHCVAACTCLRKSAPRTSGLVIRMSTFSLLTPSSSVTSTYISSQLIASICKQNLQRGISADYGSYSQNQNTFSKKLDT